MANVPSYGGPQVMPSIMGYRPMSAEIPNVPKMGIDAGLQKAGDRLDRIYTKYLDEQDDARVTEALTSLRQRAIDLESGEGGWASQLGANALQADKDGKGLVERYDTELRSYGSELAAKLTPRQQRKFAEKAGGVYQAQYGASSQHVFQQSMKHSDDVQVARAAQTIQSGAVYWNRPEALKAGVVDIQAAAEKRASLNGWDKTMKNNFVLDQTSKMFSNAITAALAGAEQNPYKARDANAVLEANARHMQPADIAKFRVMIDGYLQKARMNDVLNGLRIEGEAKQSGPASPAIIAETGGKLTPEQAASRSYALAVNAVYPTAGNLQSFVKDYGVGNEDLNRYGIGNLRVKDAQETAEAHGIQFDQKRFTDDKGYNAELARLRVDDLYRKYAGDETKVFAAYFAGEDKVAEAIKRAEEENAKGVASVWTDYIVGDAKSQMASCLKAMERADGERLKAGEGDLSSFLPENAEKSFNGLTPEEIRAGVLRLDPLSANDANYRESLIAQGIAQENQRKATWVATHQKKINDITDVLYANRGNLQAIPMDSWAGLTRKEQQDVITLAKKISKGEDSTDLSVFLRYKSDKVLLTSLSEEGLRGLRPFCSAADWRVLAAEYYTQKGEIYKAYDEQVIDRRNALFDAKNTGAITDEFAKLFTTDTIQSLLKVRLPGFQELLKEDAPYAGAIALEYQKALAFQYQQMDNTSKSKFKLDEALSALVSRTQYDVQGFFGMNKKSVINLTTGDLPRSGGPSDAFWLVEAATRNRVGHDPSEAEMRQTMVKICMDPGYQPDFGFDAFNNPVPGKKQFMPNDQLWASIVAANPGADKRMIAKLYIAARMSGVAPMAEPAKTNLTGQLPLGTVEDTAMTNVGVMFPDTEADTMPYFNNSTEGAKALEELNQW